MQKPKILFISPCDFDALEKKGVSHMLLDRSEGDFFEHTYTIHPFATKSQKVNLSSIFTLYEFLPTSLPNKKIFSVLNKLLVCYHLIKVFIFTIFLIKKEKINIIRATDPYYSGLLGYAASKVLRKPLCISIHAHYDKRYQLCKTDLVPTIFGSRKLSQILESYILKRADAIMPIYEDWAKWVESKGVDKDKIKTIPIGINVKPFFKEPNKFLKDSYDINNDTKIISFIGRLSKDNYVYEMLMALDKLAYQDWVVLIAGEGPEKDAMIKFINEKIPSLKQKIKFLGFIEQKRVIDIRLISDVAICLMGGLSLLESCAAKSATVCFDVEWHGELIINNKSGILIPEGNIHMLSKSIDNLLHNPDVCKKIGEFSQKIVMSKYTIEEASKKRQELYSSLLDKR